MYVPAKPAAIDCNFSATTGQAYHSLRPAKNLTFLTSFALLATLFADTTHKLSTSTMTDNLLSQSYESDEEDGVLEGQGAARPRERQRVGDHSAIDVAPDVEDEEDEEDEDDGDDEDDEDEEDEDVVYT
jgi:TATA-binding protein-associated factor Taf7